MGNNSSLAVKDCNIRGKWAARFLMEVTVEHFFRILNTEMTLVEKRDFSKALIGKYLVQGDFVLETGFHFDTCNLGVIKSTLEQCQAVDVLEALVYCLSGIIRLPKVKRQHLEQFREAGILEFIMKLWKTVPNPRVRTACFKFITFALAFGGEPASECFMKSNILFPYTVDTLKGTDKEKLMLALEWLAYLSEHSSQRVSLISAEVPSLALEHLQEFKTVNKWGPEEIKNAIHALKILRNTLAHSNQKTVG